MKVSLLAHTTPFSGTTGMGGGITKILYNVGKELIGMGHDVKLTVRNDYVPKEKWIETVYSPKISWMLYPYFLKGRLSKIDADVYHADYVTTGAPLIWKKKRPSVVSIHDVIPFKYDMSKQSRANKLRVWWYMKNFKTISRADSILVLSEYAKKEALEYTNLDEDKIRVVYIGADVDHFHPLKRKPNKKLKIGYVGGLDGRKNVTLLIDAFKDLLKERNDVELHVGGGGSNLEKFRSMNLKNAKFYGFVPDKELNKFLNSLDVFVYPTLDEGFGLPPLEAMTAGTPVVAANTCSMPEVVGKAGLLVEPNPKSMKEGLLKMIDSSSLRKKYSKLGITNAKKFTWKASAKNTLKIYKELVE